MELVLATWNKKKLKWLTNGFSHLGLKISSIDRNEVDDVEESGITSAENALIKVRAVGAKSNSIIIGEDSILAIDALDGFPGVKTVRWSEGSDDDRSTKLLDMMKDVPEEKRTASFQSSIGILFPDGTEKSFTGELDGKITSKISDEFGKGYQRIFLLPDGESIAQSESSTIMSGDHRDKAIKLASEKIQNWLGENLNDKK